MDNRKTIYLFLVLIFFSWVIELFVGWELISWWWGTAWFSWSSPGAMSLAQFIADFAQGLHSTTFMRLNLRWTSAGVILFIYELYILLHGMHAVWNGLLRPLMKRWQLGPRRPTDREVKQFEMVYATIVRNAREPVSRPRWLVAEGPGLDMRYIGYPLVIDRELLSHRAFPALLAAQLAHANSEDRLAHRLYAMLPPSTMVAAALGGWPFSIGHALLFPLWMWYWRARVFAGDQFAVECGQGYQLVRALDEIYLRVDTSTRGGRFLKPVPYVASRIDRIQRLLEQRSPGTSRVI